MDKNTYCQRKQFTLKLLKQGELISADDEWVKEIMKRLNLV